MKLDQFIPDYYQDVIEDYMSRSEIWSFDDNVSGMRDMRYVMPEGLYIAERQFGFSSAIYSPKMGWQTNEKLFAILQPMIKKMMEIFPIPLEIYRVRGGLMTRQRQTGLNYPHTDYFQPHYTFLYYVNDSDGDTFLFNEKVDYKDTDHKMPTKFTLMDRVAPKKGDAIIFNGLLYHCSSTPENHDSRIAININLFPINNNEV